MKTAADLLKAKTHQTVLTIHPATSVFEALKVMAAEPRRTLAHYS